MTENAHEEPDALYYFCALNSDERKQWFREIIQDCRVYFRHRDQLNDLNELRPEIVIDGSNKEIRDFVRNLIISKSPVKLSPAQRLIEENRLIHRYKNSSRGVEEMLHEILDKIGVFSLTETISEQLLWAHYADAHRGVAIEFDPQSGLFTNAQKVVYTNELPVINRLRDGSDVILEKKYVYKG